MLDYALGTLKLAVVVADIDPANTSSIGVARKLGFRMLGPIGHAGRIVDRYVVRPGGARA